MDAVESYKKRREDRLAIKRFHERRAARLDSRMDAEDEGWKTIKGTHVLVGESGEVVGGPDVFKGKSFESIKKTAKENSRKQAKEITINKSAVRTSKKPGEVRTGKTGNLRPKSDLARRINTKDAFEELQEKRKLPADPKDPKGYKRSNSLADYMDENGNLSPERQAVHDEIIRKFFEDKVPFNGKPTLIMAGGGSASGKSFVSDAAKENFGEETTCKIDPDDFKDLLPGYSKMAWETKEAAGYYHEESSALAKRAYQFAVENGLNVVYDGTGDGSVNSVKKKLKAAQEKGYQIHAQYVTVNIDEALKRNQQRYENALEKVKNGTAKKPARLPDPEVVTKIHKKVTDISVEVCGEFDSFELYDNNGPKGSQHKIATCKKGGKLTVVPGMEKELQAYLDKGYRKYKIVNGIVEPA